MKLQKKIALTFLLGAFVPIAIGMAFITYEVSLGMVESGKTNADDYVKLLASRVNSSFNDWLRVSDVLSRFDFIKEKDWQKLDPVFKEITDEYPEITGFVITNPDGSYWYGPVQGNPHKNYLVTADPSDPDAPLKYVSSLHYQQELVVKNTAHERKGIVSDIYISVAQKLKMFCIASTIIENGRVQGVVGVSAASEAIRASVDNLLYDFERTFGSESRLLITSGQKKDVLINYVYNDLSRSFVDKASSMDTIEDVSALSENLVSALAELEGNRVPSVMYKRDDGKECYLSYMPIGETNYKVYLSVPVSKLIESSSKILKIIVVISLIIDLVVIFISVVVSAGIIRTLSKTSQKFDDLSFGSGDLTVQLEAGGNDELSDLGKKFNVFMGKLRDMISRVSKETSSLDSVSTNLDIGVSEIKTDIEMISENVSNLNSKTSEQNNSVAETAASVEQIAKRIDALSSSVDLQTNAVANSSSSIEEMVGNINSIADNLEKASKRFDELHEASTTGKTNIANVQSLVDAVSQQSTHLLDTNKLINSIANQTNLLAMNAAIEAAHAGESGRGFSVVAEEIRKLAEDSSKQSKTIADELKSIVSNITNIVDATAKAGTSFDIVVNQVKESSQIVEDISLALKEQSTGNKHVLDDLVNIQNTTEDVRDGSIEMKYGVDTILKETQILTDISNQVKDISEEISKTLTAIGIAVDMVKQNSLQNTDAVDSLSELVSKFKV